MSDIGNCSACNSEIEYQSRYPNCLCDNCIKLLSDIDGNPVEYHNIDMWGGIQGKYKDTGEIYFENICYINEVKCRAEEGRFGGIVVQVVTP